MSENNVDSIQQSILSIIEEIDKTDDPAIRKRLIKSLQKHTQKLRDLHTDNEQAQKAADVLDQCLIELTKGKVAADATRDELKKIKLKIIDKNLSGD